MIGTVGDGFALFAPHANSYRRFKANSYAPVAPTWGVNNRTVSFRIPAGPPPSRHVEHRACGADANPYLAVAAVLAGMHHGMTNQAPPSSATATTATTAATTSHRRTGSPPSTASKRHR
jgi:glutamine synthetase